MPVARERSEWRLLVSDQTPGRFASRRFSFAQRSWQIFSVLFNDTHPIHGQEIPIPDGIAGRRRRQECEKWQQLFRNNREVSARLKRLIRETVAQFSGPHGVARRSLQRFLVAHLRAVREHKPAATHGPPWFRRETSTKQRNVPFSYHYQRR